MLCDHCQQNEAIIHLTQIVDNQMTTKHLCEACAADKGLQPGTGAVNVPLTDFLSQVGKQTPDPTIAPCPFCGLKLDEFRKAGRLGCSHCWVSFEPNLRGLVRRLHGGTQHVGKVYLPPNPSRDQQRERLAGLRRKLSRAVESEDFERAAEIRDLIRTLESAN
ncbi:MAG: UvrB/UvrC motif-containing protein [Gemmatimonadetes bacterium]|nr:UvrB/UvrC motif-containing protein [Gemmatimonadota bacterium]